MRRPLSNVLPAPPAAFSAVDAGGWRRELLRDLRILCTIEELECSENGGKRREIRQQATTADLTSACALPPYVFRARENSCKQTTY